MDRGYRTIVVGGAGSNIYAYVGALEALALASSDSKKPFDKVKNFIGSSAGALITGILACGGDIEYLKRKMGEINLSSIQDHSRFTVVNLYNVCKTFGYNRGDVLLGLVETVINELTGNKNITLQGLYELNDRKINLVVTGCNVSKHQLRYFNRLSDPQMKVADAIRISMGIPLFFKPFVYEKDLYIDGSVIASVPMEFVGTDMFKLLNEYDPEIIGLNVLAKDRKSIETADRNMYDLKKDTSFTPGSNPEIKPDSKSDPGSGSGSGSDSDPGYDYILNRTIGMKTFAPRALEYIDPETEGESPGIRGFTIISFTEELVDMLYDSIQKYHIDEKIWEKIIKIDTGTASSVSFDMTDETKLKLLDCGKLATEKYLHDTEAQAQTQAQAQAQAQAQTQTETQAQTQTLTETIPETMIECIDTLSLETLGLAKTELSVFVPESPGFDESMFFTD